jgi:hypothetical protein
MGDLQTTTDNLLYLAEEGGWEELPLNQRKHVMQQFESRVKEMEVTRPFDTSTGIKHHFGDGTYGREANVPTGVCMVGSVYKTPQVNVLTKGKCLVITENKLAIMTAPCIFVSDAGTNKVGCVLEDMQWITVMSRDNSCIEPESILAKHVQEGG